MEDLSDLCGELQGRDSEPSKQNNKLSTRVYNNIAKISLYTTAFSFGVSMSVLPFGLGCLGYGMCNLKGNKDALPDSLITGMCFAVGSALRYKLNHPR